MGSQNPMIFWADYLIVAVEGGGLRGWKVRDPDIPKLAALPLLKMP